MLSNFESSTVNNANHQILRKHSITAHCYSLFIVIRSTRPFDKLAKISRNRVIFAEAQPEASAFVESVMREPDDAQTEEEEGMVLATPPRRLWYHLMASKAGRRVPGEPS